MDREPTGTDDAGMEVPLRWGKDQRRWHFNKTIGVSDLVSLLIVLVPLLIWGRDVETRFATFEARYANMEKQRAEDRLATESKLTDLQQQLRTIDMRVNDKLDRISERVGASTTNTPSKLLGDR